MSPEKQFAGVEVGRFYWLEDFQNHGKKSDQKFTLSIPSASDHGGSVAAERPAQPFDQGLFSGKFFPH
ncbi:MAG: hypothetical protein ACKVVO_07800 [Opitutaceae bacterium]